MDRIAGTTIIHQQVDGVSRRMLAVGNVLQSNEEIPLINDSPPHLPGGSSRRVSAIRIECSIIPGLNPNANVDEHATGIAAQLLFSATVLHHGWHVLFFGATAGAVDRTTMNLKKGLWGGMLRGLVSPSLGPRAEVVVSVDSGVRFAGVASVRPDSFASLSSVVRRFPTCAFLVSRQREDLHRLATETFAAAFFKTAEKWVPVIAWSGLVQTLAARGIGVVRIPNGEPRDVSVIDIFSDVDLHSLLKSVARFGLR